LCENAKETKGLIWFRNDLRVHDNESLFNAVENNESVIAVYCFDPDILQNQDLALKNRKIQS
jgi:deoxyribodipyrimidine photolyase